ncbi:MAG: glycoside hydrolase family 3 C-terminal domain-containing protein [Gemmatimonadaceae bacterium]|nr:glycoside hydrolase family 3 C-terminal domain-containing protein [Gemmatimonadaceae bacterium]
MIRAFACLLAMLAAPLGAQWGTPAPPPHDPRVEALLRQMTLQEKIGEMTQLTLQAVARTRGTATVAMQVDSAKLEHMLVDENVGSLLNVYDAAMTPAQWTDLTTTVQRFASRKRLRIPVLYGIDAVHGHNYMRGATLFPQNVAMAATWNPALVRAENAITAYETRASGISWNFSPVLDLGRQPLWSRFFETFGEDVLLASSYGVNAVAGLQGDPARALERLLQGHPVDSTFTAMVVPGGSRAPAPFAPLAVAATGKHFLGYSMSRSGKDRTTAWIPDRQLRELFVPPFKAAVDAGLRTIMVNSGDVNGVPVHASRELLTDLLRTDLGFRGVVVTDWEDIGRLVTVHHVAATRRDAVRMAINAGVDMSMVPYDVRFTDDLASLVHAGEISESRVDESVRRILALKFDLGLFDDPLPRPAELAHANAPAFQAVSRQSAEEAITVLENRGVLPLRKGARVLLTGPGAVSLPAQHGGWSYSWQGGDTALYPRGTRTLLESLRAELGADRVTYVQSVDLQGRGDIGGARDAARDADVVIVALAEAPSTEKPGDVEELELPAGQIALARALERTGRPVVITLFENRPRIVRDAVDSARAVILAYETGPYGGDALARVLSGAVNPSGRLPFTYPRFAGSVEHYDHAAAAEAHVYELTGGYTPQWDFGHGLSYTTFAYDSVAVTKSTIGVRDTLVLRVTVRNSGARAGKEVVQLYVRQLAASVAPPVRRLRAFQKIALAPGERRVVLFTVPVSALAFVGRDNRMGVEPGEFELIVGGRRARFTVE